MVINERLAVNKNLLQEKETMNSGNIYLNIRIICRMKFLKISFNRRNQNWKDTVKGHCSPKVIGITRKKWMGMVLKDERPAIQTKRKYYWKHRETISISRPLWTRINGRIRRRDHRLAIHIKRLAFSFLFHNETSEDMHWIIFLGKKFP
jgi:hypothetical protein